MVLILSLCSPLQLRKFLFKRKNLIVGYYIQVYNTTDTILNTPQVFTCIRKTRFIFVAYKIFHCGSWWFFVDKDVGHSGPLEEIRNSAENLDKQSGHI